MATAEKEISIQDVGPIDRLTFKIPPQGGVVVLRGPNGAGKTTALESILAASVGGKHKLAVKDGAERGEVSVGDVLLRIGKSTRRTGELDVNVLTGRYTIADLISPDYKDRACCDEHGIKMLAQLAGAGDVSMFYDLVGGQEQFEKLCPGEVAGDLDVVQLAAKVERALHKRAQEQEQLATGADSKADALSAASREIDLSQETDGNKLQGILETAISTESALRQRASDAKARIEAAAAARDSLEDAEAQLSGPTVEEAEASHKGAVSQLREAEKELEAAKLALNNAAAKVTQIEGAVRTYKAQIDSATNKQALLDRFRATVKAGENVEPVGPGELEAARQAVTAARAALEQGALVRKARDDKAKSGEWRKAAADYRKTAEQHRKAAAGTDEVLSGLVSRLGSQLFVKRGRLLVKSDRGEESFWDLSDGERTEIAISVVAPTLGEPGLLPLPKGYWAQLDGAAKRRTAAAMRKAGVVAVVEEADQGEAEAGELRAEVFTG